MNLRSAPAFRRFVAAALLAAIGAAGTGCAAQSVRPWQREHLVDPIMAFKADAKKDARRIRALEAREGSTGGAGGEGGGCACK